VSGWLSQFPSDEGLAQASHRGRLLIVDDNNCVRQMLGEIFRHEADFDVCMEACNGHRAVKAAPLLRPDLIVLDLGMPVMNGLDASPKLRRLMPSVPIKMYSGIGDRFVEQQGRYIGIAALISKAEVPAPLWVQREPSLGSGHRPVEGHSACTESFLS